MFGVLDEGVSQLSHNSTFYCYLALLFKRKESNEGHQFSCTSGNKISPKTKSRKKDKNNTFCFSKIKDELSQTRFRFHSLSCQESTDQCQAEEETITLTAQKQCVLTFNVNTIFLSFDSH